MKVLAINSSPRPESQSKTVLMLSHLVKGMRDAGAEVEVVDLRRKKIKYCIGCYTCWTKTPGICVHKDDMTAELIGKWVDSDIAVLATPLYAHTVNAAMKAFIDRTIPVLEPFILERDSKSYHPIRDRQPPDVVVLSVCGFPEMLNFEHLSAYFKRLYGNRLLAEIYRPGAETLPFAGAKRDKILRAMEIAGRELVETRTLTPATLEVITQDIWDPDLFRRIVNMMWKTCIREGASPKDFDQGGLIPMPESLEEFCDLMAIAFNAPNTAGADAVVQFDFTGKPQGSCQLKIKDGALETEIGTPLDASIVIKTPFDLWIDIMAGKADPQQMFMEQKCTAEGDYDLLLKLSDWFSR